MKTIDLVTMLQADEETKPHKASNLGKCTKYGAEKTFVSLKHISKQNEANAAHYNAIM